MALTKWNELKGKGPGYIDQEEIYSYKTMKGIKNMERKINPEGDKEEMERDETIEKDMARGYTDYDVDKCKISMDGSISGTCVGKNEILNICMTCPYSIFNNPEKCCCDTNEKTDVCLEDEIFMKIYGRKACSIEDGIYILKRVISRLECVQDRIAKDALEAFLDAYCNGEKCLTCAFSFQKHEKCSVKVQLAHIERRIKQGENENGD